MIENDVAAIQACFPEVYFACHTRHATQADAPKGLTQRDGTLLAHIAGLEPVESGELARHLGRTKTTLSAAIQKLVRMGLITASSPVGDARRKILAVTAEWRCRARRFTFTTRSGSWRPIMGVPRRSRWEWRICMRIIRDRCG